MYRRPKKLLFFVSFCLGSFFLSNQASARFVVAALQEETRLKIKENSPLMEEEELYFEEETLSPEISAEEADEETMPLPEIPQIKEEEIREELFKMGKELSEVEDVKANGYKMGPDDVIKVSVLRHTEFSGEFLVEPNGFISLPYLDPVKAEGLSKYELKEKLEGILSQFIESPKVDVRILEYNSQAVYVVGAVNHPGKYSTQGKKFTVRDAIVAAGMPIHGASLRYAYVFSTKDPNQPKRTIKLYNVIYRGKVEQDIELKPGDIVYVRSTVISKLGIFLDQLLNPVERATTIRDIERSY